MTERARALLRMVILNLITLVILFPVVLWWWFDSEPWHALWVVGLLVLFPQVYSLPESLRRFRAREWRPLPRMTLKQADGFAVWLLYVGMFSAICLLEIDGLTEIVRLRTTMDPVMAFFLGMATYLPLVLVFGFAARRTHGPLASSRGFLRRMRRLIPRERKGRRIITAALLINPFIEELAYRGVLVLLLSTFVGVVPAVLFGLAACLAGHLYQGPGGMPFHAAFYALVVCILFSEGGMWGAFGFHFAGDIVPWMQVPRVLKNLKSLRAARAAAHPGRRGGKEEPAGT